MSTCVVWIASLLVAQSPESLGWKTYSPKGAGFSVALPSKPDEGRKGGTINLLTTEGVRTYSAGRLVVPRIPRGQRDEIYDSITQSNLRDFKGKLLGEKEIEINGVPGREITIDGYDPLDLKLKEKNPSKAITKMRFAVSGTSQYIFFVSYSPDIDPDSSAKQAKVFLESCKITN